METNNFTEKLNTFTSLVMKDANAKREKLLENVEKEYSERMDEKETELLKYAYENIQQGVQEAKKEANDRLRHAELESRKKLIVRREEIIEEIMKEAKSKLLEFIKSDKYEEWLLGRTEKALFEVGKGKKTVVISSDDVKLKEKIEQILEMPDLTVEASGERDFLGGVKVINTSRKVAVDYSFGEMLLQQKREFLQSSGLTLD